MSGTFSSATEFSMNRPGSGERGWKPGAIPHTPGFSVLQVHKHNEGSPVVLCTVEPENHYILKP